MMTIIWVEVFNVGLVKEAQEIVSQVREAFPSLPAIKFRVTRNTRVYGLCYAWEDTISLSRPRVSTSKEIFESTVIHEIAHLIAFYRDPILFLEETHGRQFWGICKELSRVTKVPALDII